MLQLRVSAAGTPISTGNLMRDGSVSNIKTSDDVVDADPAENPE